MTKKVVLFFVKTILPILLGIYLFWYFFDSMEQKELDLFYASMKEAEYSWIIVSLILGFGAFVSRAMRWKYMLEPLGYPSKRMNRYHAIMIGYLVNLTIPRAGEASRAAMLYRSDGIPFAKSFGTIITERIIDLAILGSFTLFTIFWAYDDFFLIKTQMQNVFGTEKTEGPNWFLIGFIILCLTFCMVLYLKKQWRNKIIALCKEVLVGLISIFKTKNPSAFILHTIFIWSCYVVMFMLPFYSFEQTKDLPTQCMFIAFVAGAIGMTFTNSGVGSYPILVGLVVTFYLNREQIEDSKAIGNALGLLIWASQTFVMAILGLFSLVLLPNNYSKKDA